MKGMVDDMAGFVMEFAKQSEVDPIFQTSS